MRKPIFPRVLLLLLVYFGIFTALVSIQFAKQGSITKRAGSFVVSGQYRMQDNDGNDLEPNEFIPEGDVHISFGGIDFCVANGANDQFIIFIGKDETRREVFPERMIIQDNSVHFVFPGGAGLDFNEYSTAGSPEIRISGIFAEDVSAIELPFKLQRRTGIQNAGDGQFIFRSGGRNYTFANSQMDSERRILLIESGGRPVSYRAVPDSKALSPADFILAQAATSEAYNEAITRWRDESFSLWNRIVSTGNDEDVVVALLGEAFARRNYNAAVAAVPSAFLRGSSRTYVSSVYLGNLDQAYPLLSAAEREKSSRLSRQIGEKSLEFLLETDVFQYLAIRGSQNLINAAMDLVRSIDPNILAMDIIPGIFEGYLYMSALRPGTENHFERLMDDACQLVFRSLRKTDEGVFAVYEGGREKEFNLRLGKSIKAYAEKVQDETLAGIGRSLILSALSMGSALDTEPGAARLYRILKPLDTYPRSLAIAAAGNNVWAWTAAQSLSAVQQSDVLTITVTFPANETHYMIIRGIRPFVRLQLYNMDFRTDPQFERYDSSGWSYIPQEQTLIVKMRHRSNSESIRIIFREAPRPVAAPEPVDAEEADASGNSADSGIDS